MGTWSGHKAKFVRRFADLKSERDSGLRNYVEAVRKGIFPNESESYTMDESEWEKFLLELGSKESREQNGRQSPPSGHEGHTTLIQEKNKLAV